jgi:hypothetical protein
MHILYNIYLIDTLSFEEVIKFALAYLRPDFYRVRSINSSKNLWHPPEALGQQDVGHSGVAAGRGDLSQSSSIQQGFVDPH